MTARASVDVRAAGLAPRVERVAKGIYWVPSQSDPEGFHVVVDRQAAGISGTGRWACDCAAAGFGRGCAHIHAAVARRQVEQQRREGGQR